MANQHRSVHCVFNPGNDFQKPSRTGFVNSIIVTRDCDQPRCLTYQPRGFLRSLCRRTQYEFRPQLSLSHHSSNHRRSFQSALVERAIEISQGVVVPT